MSNSQGITEERNVFVGYDQMQVLKIEEYTREGFKTEKKTAPKWGGSILIDQSLDPISYLHA